MDFKHLRPGEVKRYKALQDMLGSIELKNRSWIAQVHAIDELSYNPGLLSCPPL
jgi:hypothetical protein